MGIGKANKEELKKISGLYLKLHDLLGARGNWKLISEFLKNPYASEKNKNKPRKTIEWEIGEN